MRRKRLDDERREKRKKKKITEKNDNTINVYNNIILEMGDDWNKGYSDSDHSSSDDSVTYEET